MVSTEQAGHTSRRHRARQVRARIVQLAQAYREACRQHEEISVYVMSLLTPTDALRDEDVLLPKEQRTWEGVITPRAEARHFTPGLRVLFSLTSADTSQSACGLVVPVSRQPDPGSPTGVT